MGKNELASCWVWVLVLMSVSFAPSALADVTGTILGTVTDPGGASVAGGKVTLTNGETGLTRGVTTDANGAYEFLAVPIGSGYTVQVEAAGFRRDRQTNIVLTVNQTFRADFRLSVGQVAEQVEVKANATQVETTTNQLGEVIESKAILAMPLNGRSYTDLLSLQPGVAPITSSAGATERTPSGSLNPGVLSVNGARENGNSFLINGGDVNESRDNGASIVPTLDSIAEFRILTNNYDAQYGKFAGGIINVVTKSGTNRVHGDLFEFLRNDVLDARNYFEPTRGNFKQNQFGGTIGGPIRRNRLFFFTDYQGTRQILGVQSGNIVVPSLAERSGDFSDTSNNGLPSLHRTVGGSNAPGDLAQTLSERLGYTVTSGEPYWITGCNTLAQAQAGMCVFPGQVIPQSAWSPAAAGTLKFMPTPITSAGGIPFWRSGSQNQTLRDDKFGERIDFNNNQNSLWSFYYSFDDSSFRDPYAGGNVPGFPGLTPSRGQQANVRNNRSLGTLAVNTLTLNYTGYSIRTDAPSGSGLGNPSTWGFVSGGLGIIPTAPQYSGVPEISLIGAYSATFGVPTTINRQANHTFQVSDVYARTSGRHTLTFGTDLRYYQINTRQNIHVNGTFSFDGSETGNDFADYLIGAPNSYTQASLQLQNIRTKYFSLFGQDSFKVTPSLTLNYGLRWEAGEPFYDTMGFIMTFVPGEQSKVFPNAPTGWVFPGDPGIPKTISPTRWHNFAPRFGIAYSPGPTTGLAGKLFGGPGKTSIRAGGGIFYTSFEELIANYMVGDAPFGNFYVSPTLVYFEEPFKSRVSTNDPGQRFPVNINLPSPNGNPVSFAPYLPIASSQVWPTTNVVPYVEQFNVSIQRQIANSTIATIGYVGSFGRHLIGQKDFNPGNQALCLGLNQPTDVMAGSVTCGPNNEDNIFRRSNGQTVYGTRPYSITSGRYLSLGELDFSFNPAMGTIASSSYNALQASLERKSGPFEFLAGYTYSKSIDDTSGFIGPFINPYNPILSRALSAFNLTHNFVLSYSYVLPFGHLFGSGSHVAHALLDGWQLSGITRFATGQPVPISQSGDLSLCGCPNSDVDKPNYLGGPIKFFNPRSSTNHQFFSTDQFTSETLGVAGNSSRSFFGGPGLNEWDMALHRVIAIRESTSLEFRAEFFNIFNHAQFLTTTGQLTSGTLSSAGNFNSATFGDALGARDPRIGQIALKLSF